MKSSTNSFILRAKKAAGNIIGPAQKRYSALEIEHKVAFWGAFLTPLSLLFPWVTYTALRTEFVNNGYTAPTWAIGLTLVAISLIILWTYLRDFWSISRLRVPLPKAILLIMGGGLGLLLALLSWTVLLSVGRAYGESEIRMGLFLTCLLQLLMATSGWLLFQKQKEELVRRFFQI